MFVLTPFWDHLKALHSYRWSTQWILITHLLTSLATPTLSRMLDTFQVGSSTVKEKWKESFSCISNHIHSQIIDVSSSESDIESDDAQSTPSPPLVSLDARPNTDKDVSDGDKSVYQSADEENDQVGPLNSFLTRISNSIFDRQADIDAPLFKRGESDLAYSIKGMHHILIPEQGSGDLGEFLTPSGACFPVVDLSSADKILSWRTRIDNHSQL